MNDVFIDGVVVVGLMIGLYWAVRAANAVVAKGEARPEAVAEIAVAAPANDDLAAITAAVYAIVGPHRIVEIDRAGPSDEVVAIITAAVYAMVGTPHRIVDIEEANESSLLVAAGL